jgi:hypothetical protein
MLTLKSVGHQPTKFMVSLVRTAVAEDGYSGSDASSVHERTGHALSTRVVAAGHGAASLESDSTAIVADIQVNNIYGIISSSGFGRVTFGLLRKAALRKN